MTEKQAEVRLKKLLKQECTCGDCDPEDVAFCRHFSGCPYRVAVMEKRDLIPFAGDLYPARAA